jgi:hypothetical protein
MQLRIFVFAIMASVVAFAQNVLSWALPAQTSSSGTDLVIMLDMSMGPSVQEPIVRILSGGARVAATELKPGDRVSLVEFSGTAKTTLPPTDDVRKFESALRKAGTWTVEHNQRHLYDSLLSALSTFPEAGQSDRRRCILVMTTSSDVGSRHSSGDVALSAKSKDAAIFVALLSPPTSLPHLMPGGRLYPNGPGVNEDEERKALEPLVVGTGGEIRVYEANQYAIARAIGDMVNK